VPIDTPTSTTVNRVGRIEFYFEQQYRLFLTSMDVHVAIVNIFNGYPTVFKNVWISQKLRDGLVKHLQKPIESIRKFP